MIFDVENTGEFRNYLFLREERHQFQGLQNENSIEAILKVKLIKADSDFPIFEVRMKSYKQTNEKGLYKWVGDLHELREYLVFSLNENGNLGEILNLEDVVEKWNEIKPKLQLRHRKEQYSEIFFKGIDELLTDATKLADALRFAMPYALLFPGMHVKEYKKSETIKGYRELPNFLATKSVPVVTEESIEELEDGKYQIEVKGFIDEEKFEQDKVTAMIRILKNRPRVPSTVELQYTERYLLEDWPWSEQSMCMSLVQIPGTLYREEKNILKVIKENGVPAI